MLENKKGECGVSEEIKETNYWLVGSKWDSIDKTEDFVRDGVWINGFGDKYLDRVKSVNIGDKIAINRAKSTQSEDCKRYSSVPLYFLPLLLRRWHTRTFERFMDCN